MRLSEKKDFCIWYTQHEKGWWEETVNNNEEISPARMQRVLSFQMTRNIGESSEYVTKRLCFSFLFSVGFLCLLCGFLLGRFTVERSLEAQAQKTRGELAGNGLRNTEDLQQQALLDLERASFDYTSYVVLTSYPLIFISEYNTVTGLISTKSPVRKLRN